MTYWRRWVLQPQTTWLRKAIFQIHLWSGIGIGLYVLLVSVTGSIAVYSNELYRGATSAPIIVAETAARLSDEQLKSAALSEFPGYKFLAIGRARNPDQAVSISLQRGAELKNRLFNPYSGADLGDSVPRGIRLVSGLLKLHDDLMAGPTGRSINGVGAGLIVILAFTGIIVWWPGIKTWRRSLTIPRHAGWQRFNWGLHGVVGFWSLGFIVLFGISGIYLGNPEFFQDLADRIEPLTDANARTRIVDQVIYWVAYLHVGRINGIGILCSGPGLCDFAVKLTWAVFGLTPAVMFVTGALMWWNRVARKKLKEIKRPGSLVR